MYLGYKIHLFDILDTIQGTSRMCQGQMLNEMRFQGILMSYIDYVVGGGGGDRLVC